MNKTVKAAWRHAEDSGFRLLNSPLLLQHTVVQDVRPHTFLSGLLSWCFSWRLQTPNSRLWTTGSLRLHFRLVLSFNSKPTDSNCLTPQRLPPHRFSYPATLLFCLTVWDVPGRVDSSGSFFLRHVLIFPSLVFFMVRAYCQWRGFLPGNPWPQLSGGNGCRHLDGRHVSHHWWRCFLAKIAIIYNITSPMCRIIRFVYDCDFNQFSDTAIWLQK